MQSDKTILLDAAWNGDLALVTLLLLASSAGSCLISSCDVGSVWNECNGSDGSESVDMWRFVERVLRFIGTAEGSARPTTRLFFCMHSMFR